MNIKDVDKRVGAKGPGGMNGTPNKKISMATPGEGHITKPQGVEEYSERSAMHDADNQKFVGGGMAQKHNYDSSTNFSGSKGES